MMLCCCCHGFRTEFSPCQPWFQVKEPLTDKYIDIPQSFGAYGSIWILLAKLITTGFVCSTLGWALWDADHIEFYFAYCSGWSLAFAALYTLTSLSNTLIPLQQPQTAEEHEAHNEEDVEIIVVAQVRVKWTWLLLDLALTSTALTGILHWLMVYEGYEEESLAYLDIAQHGPPFLAVLIDGLFVNRIPLRWMHLWFVWFFVALYITWTILHQLVFDDTIGNPDKEDDKNQNDDAIYEKLSWKSSHDLFESVFICCIVFFGAVPILFYVLRLWSVTNLCCGDRRRYISDDHRGMFDDGKATDDEDDEHHSKTTAGEDPEEQREDLEQPPPPPQQQQQDAETQNGSEPTTDLVEVTVVERDTAHLSEKESTEAEVSNPNSAIICCA